MTGSGGTIAHEIPVAVATPAAGPSFYGLLALLGVYVGVLPIALGMLWLPWIRRVPARVLRVVMALTVGLLAFLAVDATLEGLELAGEGPQAFGGALLVLLGGAIAFLALTGVRRVAARTGAAGPRRARGWRCSSRSASGSTTSARACSSAPPTRPARSRWARSSSSASRCTTRRRAWRSSRRSRARRRRRGGSPRSGCWPAGPAVLGAWLGAAAPSPAVSALLFGAGAGAIVAGHRPARAVDARRERTGAPPGRGRRRARRDGADVRDRAARLNRASVAGPAVRLPARSFG